MSKVADDVSKSNKKNEIDILEHTSIIYPSFLEKEYTESKKNRNSLGLGYGWYDTINAWFLTESDVKFMTKKMKTQKPEFWDKNQFKSLNNISINFLNTPVLQKNRTLRDFEIEAYDRLEKNQLIYIFSVPVFNKNKNAAIIAYDVLFFTGEGGVLFYKKIKNKWEIVGYCN